MSKEALEKQQAEHKAALAEIPDEVVDELVVHGTPEQCRARIQEYFDNGVTTSTLAILPLDPDLDFWQGVRATSDTPCEIKPPCEKSQG